VSKAKKRTLQISVWSDDDDAVAAYVNMVRLAAAAAFGADNQDVIFSGVGVQAVRASLEALDWRSANVTGRMKVHGG